MSKKFNRVEMLDERGQLLIGKFSDFLIEEHNIVTINNTINTYKEGVYVPGEKVIEQSMLNYFPNIRQSQRKEVLSQIVLKAKECNNTNTNRHLIAFKNGVYNIATQKMQPFSKEYIIPNKIEWNYNPDAYCKDIDVLFDNIADNDPEIRARLEELIGYSMYRSLEKQVAAILVGGGSNGKSTYTKIIRHLLGEGNCAAVELAALSNDRYAPADLYGKLVCMGDDISGEYISDPSTFKSITSGETIRAQQKYQQAFNFSSYATPIFSTNNVPRIKNCDGGVKRRMMIIPFLHRFDPTAPDFDGGIAFRIMFGCDEYTADEAMSYLINLAIKGLHRILVTTFTASKKCDNCVEEYEKECNPTIEWAEEYEERFDTFDGQKRDLVYEDYKAWALSSGQKPLSKNGLVRFVNERYHMEVVPKYYPGVGAVRTFVCI